MMETITIQNMRHAIEYVNNGNSGSDVNLQEVSDEQLLNYDFTRDLHMGNIRLTNVINELQKVNGLHLPIELFRLVPDNRVKSLLDTINLYLREAEKMTQS